jgi:hypothetical protein
MAKDGNTPLHYLVRKDFANDVIHYWKVQATTCEHNSTRTVSCTETVTGACIDRQNSVWSERQSIRGRKHTRTGVAL